MFRSRALLVLFVLGFLGFAAILLLLVVPLRTPHPRLQLLSGALAISGARVYVSPDQAPVEGATVVARHGRIESVGRGISVPADARVLPCTGCTVIAGFWNSHVHFTQSKWDYAAYQPASALNAKLSDMLTSRGFTTVVDTGSDPRTTVSLRRRIEAGELRGPAIYTAGTPLYPPRGIPYYLRDSLPAFLLWTLPQPATPAEAASDVDKNIGRGADLLKLFTGSWVARGRVLPMPVEIARAAAEAAHRHGQLVFSHPSNLAGTTVARDSGVDVLAHAADETSGIDAPLLKSLVDHHMAMIPTLKMFGSTVTKKPAYLEPIYEEIRQFHSMGGELMFGTDVGYMTDYATQDEFDALAQSGLNWRDMMKMLTTAPARRFQVDREKGTLETGRLADFVVLRRDPAANIGAFSEVLYTVRGGRMVYAAR